MARTSSILKAEAESLRLEDVQQHLQIGGWARDAAASWATASIFRKNDREIVLPTSRGLADYAARMADVVQTLSEEANRSPRLVLAALLRPPSTDAIRLREVSATTTQGFIPIREGVRLIKGGLDGLLAAAHSACDPVGFHPRMGVREATDLVDRCRLGTDRGSFIATILVPVPLEIDIGRLFPASAGEDLDDDPFERRVTRLFMSALGVVRKSLDNGTPEAMLQSARLGLSANFCEAIVEMLPESDQSFLEVTTDWSPTRRPAPSSTPSSVTLRAGEQMTVRSIAQQLKQRQEPTVLTLVGTIVALSGDTTSLFGDASNGFTGRVRLQTPLFDSQVQLTLKASDFQTAVEAYRVGARVRVSGLIRRTGQTVELQQPSTFERVVVPSH